MNRVLVNIALISFVSFTIPVFATTNSQDKLAALEDSSGVKLGVYALDTANHEEIQYRANERFPMGCTSKTIGVAAVLKKSMTDESVLQKRMTYTKQELTKADWAPISAQHLAEGMTIKEASAAAIMYSDNMAMNLVLKELGGTEAVNNFAKNMGDNTFKMDHDYPAEAYLVAGSSADTTTPAAMAKSYQKLVFGDVLAPKQKNLLITWLKNNTTGNARIRAGVPKGWAVADKTGTSTYGTANDVAIIWPPKCSPIVLAVYTTQNKKDAKRRDDALVAAARIVLQQFAESDLCLRRYEKPKKFSF